MTLTFTAHDIGVPVMRKHWVRNIRAQQWLADRAVTVAKEQRKGVDDFADRVETTVNDQKRLMRENNFAARLERAYR